jgi:hypothetical protein
MYSERPATRRAAQQLITDPRKSDLALAEIARTSSTTIASVRARLEAVGVIERVKPADRTPRPRPQRQDSPAALAIAAGARTPRQVADAAGISLQAAWRALRKLNPPLHDAAAAADALSVSASACCERCHAPFTFTPRPNRPPRRWCGPDCRRPVRDPSAHHPPPITELPPFDFSKGLCTHVPPSQATWWTSDNVFLREAARELCLACPLLVPCAEWSMHLPRRDTAIYGGMGAPERRALRSGHLPPRAIRPATGKPSPRNLR